MEYANLSVEEIRRQLEEAESRKAELNRMLETRREQGKEEVIEQIRTLIESHGYDYDEILPLVRSKKKRGKKSVSSREYTRYVDPENDSHVYVRGVLPGWMKDKMRAQGFDPSSKKDREAFKANSLRVLEG